MNFYKYLYLLKEEPAYRFDINQEVLDLQKKQFQIGLRTTNKVLVDWEKHTNGIGSKLMHGVNYK